VIGRRERLRTWRPEDYREDNETDATGRKTVENDAKAFPPISDALRQCAWDGFRLTS